VLTALRRWLAVTEEMRVPGGEQEQAHPSAGMLARASAPLRQVVGVIRRAQGRSRSRADRGVREGAAALPLTASANREDRWRVIGPGGGGALFHPTVSPHDSRTALVSCDMTGNYMTTDAGSHWRGFNLGAPVRFFLFDPSDPHVIYAQAGALFRSSDGGTTWARLLPAAVTRITMGNDHASETLHVASGPRGEIGAMAIDPADSRVLYVTIDSGLWTSLDGGATWRKSAELPGSARWMWIDARSSRTDRPPTRP